ncbi:MAG: ribosome-binding factor A [Candidatus Peregrinibacteria bacterium]|nr:ribosome-binding factor A [Candidatus Peregrinibacteria bacterium]MCB9808304.1 ribosome-binding factor A [Candidatus Peribacteria bacterium]
MSKRPKMLASVVREVIAPVVRLCPQECKMVSITEVDVSEDFSYATVYISALDHADLALSFLESRLPELKTKMGSLYRKRIPELRFRIDPLTARSGKLDSLLSEAQQHTDN